MQPTSKDLYVGFKVFNKKHIKIDAY